VARLEYVRSTESPAADELFAEVARMGRPVLNLYRILANQPPALGAFLQMSGYIRGASSLAPGLRELVILATAYELGDPYEVAHHTDAAARAGVAPEKVAAVAPGGSLDSLSASERCAVEFARQVALSRTCDDSTFALLQSLFTREQIVDLVVTCGWYHLCAVILGSLQVELEDAGG